MVTMFLRIWPVTFVGIVRMISVVALVILIVFLVRMTVEQIIPALADALANVGKEILRVRPVVAVFVLLIVIFVPVIPVAAPVTIIIIFIIVPLGPDAGIVVAVTIIGWVAWHLRILSVPVTVLVLVLVRVVVPDIVYRIGPVVGGMSVAVIRNMVPVLFVPGARRIFS